MKRGKRLFILAAALIILCGSLWLISALTKPDSVPMGEDLGASVYSVSAEEITALSWQYEGNSFSFRQTDSGWVLSDDESYPLDQSYLQAVTDGLADVTSAKVISSPEDLTVFGLDAPTLTLTVTADTTTTLTVGNTNAIGDHMYLSVGDGNVYLVDTAFLMPYTNDLLSMVAKEPIPDLSAPASITQTTENGSFTVNYREDAGLSYSDNYVWFHENTPMDSEAMADLVSDLDSLYFIECVSYAVTDEELTVWGLDTPSVSYTVSYEATAEQEAGTFSFQLGDGSEDGEAVYIRLADSNLVYLLDGDIATRLIQTSYADLLVNDVLRMDTDSLTRIEITLDGATYTLVRTESETTDEEGNVSTQYLWAMDDAQVDPDAILQTLNTLEGTNTGQPFTPQRLSEITFVFHRNTADYQQVELAFYQYDSTNCLVSLNGSNDLLLPRSLVVDLKEAVNALILG